MLSKKIKISLIIMAVVILGLAVALLLADESFFAPKTGDNLNLNQALGQLPGENQPGSQKGFEEAVPLLKLTPDEQTITAVSRNFAERYGSYSSDSAFVNLEEVKPLSSAKMKSELQQIINEAPAAGLFYGISSKSLKVEILDLDESAGAAQTEVNLQRRESKAGQLDFVYNQKLFLSLIRSGESWLVDQAQWQ